MNHRYEVTITDAVDRQRYVIVVWASAEVAAIEAARDTIDNRERINPAGWPTSVRVLGGDSPEVGDIVLKED